MGEAFFESRSTPHLNPDLEETNQTRVPGLHLLRHAAGCIDRRLENERSADTHAPSSEDPHLRTRQVEDSVCDWFHSSMHSLHKTKSVRKRLYVCALVTSMFVTGILNSILLKWYVHGMCETCETN